jgi:hypothetical protein
MSITTPAWYPAVDPMSTYVQQWVGSSTTFYKSMQIQHAVCFCCIYAVFNWQLKIPNGANVSVSGVQILLPVQEASKVMWATSTVFSAIPSQPTLSGLNSLPSESLAVSQGCTAYSTAHTVSTTSAIQQLTYWELRLLPITVACFTNSHSMPLAWGVTEVLY